MQILWQSVDMSGIQRQVELYGEPLRDRFRRVIDVYGISQRRLAGVLGLSAPMLSQLISATRTKIGNPAVYERLVLLEQRAGDEDRQAVLVDVEATQRSEERRVGKGWGGGRAAGRGGEGTSRR